MDPVPTELGEVEDVDEDILRGPIVEGAQFEELGDLFGVTLHDLEELRSLPTPPLTDWAVWRRWRIDFGCRPPEPLQSTHAKGGCTRIE